MSNLVRQYYVVEQSSKARIINSNRKMELRLKELSEQNHKDDDGFVDGLVADIVEAAGNEEDEAEAGSVLENAKAEADRIIAEANTSAETILEDAKNHADELFEQKRLEGYNDGAKEKEDELIRRKQELENEIANKKQELEEEYAKYRDELEGDIVDAVIQVYNKVFDIQFDDKKQLLLSLVKNTVSDIEIEKNFKIRVSEANYSFMKDNLDGLKSRVGQDIDIEVVNDNKMKDTDCQIETNFGIFDCGIDMELANLEKAIRSLCN